MPYITKVAGVTHSNRQQLLAALATNDDIVGEPITLTPEPDNAYDPGAIAVYHGGDHLGYIPRTETPLVRALLTQEACTAYIVAITGGSPGYPTYGCKIFVGQDIEIPGYNSPAQAYRPGRYRPYSDNPFDIDDDPYGYGVGGPIDADDLP